MRRTITRHVTLRLQGCNCLVETRLQRGLGCPWNGTDRSPGSTLVPKLYCARRIRRVGVGGHPLERNADRGPGHLIRITLGIRVDAALLALREDGVTRASEALPQFLFLRTRQRKCLGMLLPCRLQRLQLIQRLAALWRQLRHAIDQHLSVRDGMLLLALERVQ